LGGDLTIGVELTLGLTLGFFWKLTLELGHKILFFIKFENSRIQTQRKNQEIQSSNSKIRKFENSKLQQQPINSKEGSSKFLAR
jgi:hypothetical protein